MEQITFDVRGTSFQRKRLTHHNVGDGQNYRSKQTEQAEQAKFDITIIVVSRKQ